jgi:hypothetical protein
MYTTCAEHVAPIFLRQDSIEAMSSVEIELNIIAACHVTSRTNKRQRTPLFSIENARKQGRLN